MTALFPQFETTTHIDVTGLSVSRGNTPLFADISASVNSGEVFWIKGSNGIGKTTLLEALAGITRPDAGEVRWLHGAEPITAAQAIAYQPHNSFSKATLSAKEDLTFWARIYGSLNHVKAALELVGLSARYDVGTQNLSAGQRRRLALAKLVLSQRPIWIMDEPAAAMDSDGAALIDTLINQHIARGGSAIIASHATPRKLSGKTSILTLRAEP